MKKKLYINGNDKVGQAKPFTIEDSKEDEINTIKQNYISVIDRLNLRIKSLEEENAILRRKKNKAEAKCRELNKEIANCAKYCFNCKDSGLYTEACNTCLDCSNWRAI